MHVRVCHGQFVSALVYARLICLSEGGCGGEKVIDCLFFDLLHPCCGVPRALNLISPPICLKAEPKAVFERAQNEGWEIH